MLYFPKMLILKLYLIYFLISIINWQPFILCGNPCCPLSLYTAAAQNGRHHRADLPAGRQAEARPARQEDPDREIHLPAPAL